MVTAEYREHEFSPHWHEAYAVPVIEAGAEPYAYQGGQHIAEAGTVPVINPGEEVLFLDPYFVMYPHLVTLAGGGLTNGNPMTR